MRPDEPELPAMSGELLELHAAARWRLTPREWRGQPVDDQAMMMGYVMFCDTREAYRHEFMERKREGKDQRDVSDYAKMKGAMGLK